MCLNPNNTTATTTMNTNDLVLELAADDDAKRFKISIENDPLAVDETGLWFCRRKGSNIMTLYRRTPLMVAATYGSLDVVRLILTRSDSDVNRSCGEDRSTALHCAASGGSVNAVEMITILLSAGADVSVVDANGNRPADVIMVPPNSYDVKIVLEGLLGKRSDCLGGEQSLRVLSLSPDEDHDSLSPSSNSTSSPMARKDGLERKEYPIDPSVPDIKNSIYATDEFRMFSFKVRPCSRAYSHDWTECPFVHPGENARRRDPRKYHYSCVPCPDFRKGACRRGDMCEYAHGVFECWLHPAQYRTRLCKDGTACDRRVCFFAHTTEELRPLYVSTGSALPSPRSSASVMDMAAAMMGLLPGSPSSLSVMSQNLFTHRKKQLSINYGAELERHSQDAELRAHSRDGSISQTSEQSISDEVIKPQNIKTCKLSINYGAELEKQSQDAELGTHSQDGSISQTSEQSISDDVLKPQNINTCQLSMNYGAELEKHSQDTELGTHSRDGSISQTSEQSISDDVLKPHNIKTCQLSVNYGAELEKHSQDTELGTHSRDGSISKASEQSASDDVLKPQNIKTCPDNDVTIISNTVEGLKEMVQIQYHKQFTDGQGTENPSNYDSGVKITVKDVCLEPVLKSSESPSRWPLEFEKKQREIVELWHACNVSLIHRSYFFLLIKGDPTDSFYIEVEYRRLSFLKHTFSEGSLYKTTAEDGQSDGLALRTLRREREKICRGLSRLPAAERERLYTKWDIALDSKQRRLQLSRRVWTETNDMEHARESAMLVAKVLGFLEPAQAPKEMFGLSFSPQLTSRRSFGWRNSMSSFR